MKRALILIALGVAISFGSCTEKYKKEIERLQRETDSLKAETVERDTITMAYVRAFNAIQQNLDEIKMRERLITEISEADPEKRKSMEEQINRDIEAIYELLLRNKKMVDDLQRKLRTQGIKNAELEKMIANLNTQIELKDAEIGRLKESLAQMNITIRNLETNLATMEKLSEQQTAVIGQQEAELNKVWYIIGTRKVLEEKKVLTKEGGFIGIGRSRRVSEEFDKSEFTMADRRDLRSLPIFSKKCRLVSVHPAGSYQLVGESQVDSLKILHPDDFWSASRFLVVVID
ncbi:MAG: hypothetical protein IPM52_12020 [Bacteroidetes bacterium]|nr:hypothetical protein [Bacteroidota bacterium]